MRIENIPVFTNNALNVIVETPLGSHFKYAYDPELGLMKIKYELPVGYYFPINFGFIPQTLAEDGDPLDVLIFSTEPLLSRALLETRIIGVLKVSQNKDGKIVRNDRILAMPTGNSFNAIKDIKDLGNDAIVQLENFFISYNKHRKVDIKILKRSGPGEAKKIIMNCCERLKKNQVDKIL